MLNNYPTVPFEQFLEQGVPKHLNRESGEKLK